MPVSPLHSSVASSTKSLVSAHISAHLRHFSNHYIVTPLGIFVAWLSVHTHIAYLVLFLGAYFEALIGPSFFIPGEIFLLSGAILAGAHVLNIWLVCFSLYVGAILGDSSSYWIGRIVGKSIFHERKKIFNIKNYKRAENFLEKYGPQAIFLARLIGPFAKIAPVAAGIFEIPFGTFLAYNIPGVIIGVGEFIVAGYFFGDRYQLVLLLIERYSVLFFMVLGIAIVGHWYWKKRFGAHKKSPHHTPRTHREKPHHDESDGV